MILSKSTKLHHTYIIYKREHKSEMAAENNTFCEAIPRNTISSQI